MHAFTGNMLREAKITHASTVAAFQPETLRRIDTRIREIEMYFLSDAGYKSYSTPVRHIYILTVIEGCALNANGTVFPINEQAIIRFIAWLTLKPQPVRNIGQYISAIRSYHAQNRLPVEQLYTPYIKSYIKAASNFLKAKGLLVPTRNRIPLVRAHVHHMIDAMDLSRNRAVKFSRFAVALAVGNATLMRSGEFTVRSADAFNPAMHATRGGVEFHYETVDGQARLSYATIQLPSSKTDREHRGTQLIVPALHGARYCPASMLAVWLKLRPGKPDDHIFGIDGKPYLKSDFMQMLRTYAERIGLDPQSVGGHSVRIGGATDAKDAGCTDMEIRILGRWASDTFLTYTRYTSAHIASLVKRQPGPHQPYTMGALLSWAARARLDS